MCTLPASFVHEQTQQKTQETEECVREAVTVYQIYLVKSKRRNAISASRARRFHRKFER